ncbi:unnamed protein product [Ilex paraguariensis]|uniref:Uncharacterized protein n=1 Tax=Ilex paraguariensis TaxID=185542 RepID=A0ABC8U8X6_9AQUA
MASSTASLISFTPEFTADNETNRLEDESEEELTMALAIEVLPVPGGPQKIIEGRRLQSMAERRKEFPARRCSCPTTSSMVRGRIRSANGSEGTKDPKFLLDDSMNGSSRLRRFFRRNSDCDCDCGCSSASSASGSWRCCVNFCLLD